ncbi:MAG TPA: aminoglycoside phosphotransferase family protein [Kofleriaceae bacterium]|nr:aminoglycoside phosphotransferase family protein [Kofleriaceae bacterium]
MRPGIARWIEQTLGARVVDRRRLTGGVASTVQLLTVEDGASFVLRTDAAVASEVAVLRALERTDLPVPRVIASTDDALLMTRLPGDVHLVPTERWLRQMAQMLARIHALAIEAKPFEAWIDPAQLAPPPDAARPALWRDAIALASTARVTRTCFVHRDYQHFNLLWSDERLTGVVDWGEACIAPPELDVGHCRLNLALLFSPELADRFAQIYEAEAGRAIDPVWDLHALLAYAPGWGEFLPIQIDGRAPFDPRGMTARMEAVLARALR